MYFAVYSLLIIISLGMYKVGRFSAQRTSFIDYLIVDEPEGDGSNHPSQGSKSAVANRALHTIDESHLHSTSMDEVFDPLDSFDLGNGLGGDEAPFDLGLDDLGWDPQPECAIIRSSDLGYSLSTIVQCNSTLTSIWIWVQMSIWYWVKTCPRNKPCRTGCPNLERQAPFERKDQ